MLETARVLLSSQYDYHSPGLGTTQLYNQEVVYNTKRNEGVAIKPHFSMELTPEFLR